MHWSIFTALVVVSATGIHFFSRLAKDTVDPMIALVITTGAAFAFSLCFLPAAQDGLVKNLTFSRGPVLYALVGICISLAHLGIFYMFKAGAPMSLATPIARLLPAILAVILGLFSFQETLKATQIAGLVLAVFAVVLVVK
ncbi:MAG: EamA family transporter [Rhodospirillales bacterium]|nr:EamA family transporter [Alphaproteobacteria bacterium]MCB1841004.1 EamA family transporter [Alphaproteobacteria bacterium]MCB9977333.1 EamA family transporter [Rhodospirillales bacterium]